MSVGPSQLPLGVGLRDDATLANYLPGDNASLVSHLTGQLQEGGESFLYLWGGEGVGCSHLLQAACHQADAQGKRALYLPLDTLGHFPPDILEEPERLDLLAIDDLQLVVGRKRWEEALFHGFNRLRDAGKRLVIAADRSPRQLEVKLPDLASRLSWGWCSMSSRWTTSSGWPLSSSGPGFAGWNCRRKWGGISSIAGRASSTRCSRFSRGSTARRCLPSAS